MTDTQALLTALCAAKIGTEALDKRVMLALGMEETWTNYPSDPPNLRRTAFKWPGRGVGLVLRPTLSIVDAVALVPKGWSWGVAHFGSDELINPGGGQAYLHHKGENYTHGEAATPALALSIALVEAHNSPVV